MEDEGNLTTIESVKNSCYDPFFKKMYALKGGDF